MPICNKIILNRPVDNILKCPPEELTNRYDVLFTERSNKKRKVWIEGKLIVTMQKATLLSSTPMNNRSSYSQKSSNFIYSENSTSHSKHNEIYMMMVEGELVNGAEFQFGNYNIQLTSSSDNFLPQCNKALPIPEKVTIHAPCKSSVTQLHKNINTVSVRSSVHSPPTHSSSHPSVAASTTHEPNWFLMKRFQLEAPNPPVPPSDNIPENSSAPESSIACVQAPLDTPLLHTLLPGPALGPPGPFYGEHSPSTLHSSLNVLKYFNFIHMTTV